MRGLYGAEFLFGTANVQDRVSMKYARIAAGTAKEVTVVDYSDIPVEEICRVESVFRMLENYQFGLIQQTRLFGMDISTIETMADLREVVYLLAVDRKSPRILERIECLEMIGAGFATKFGADVKAQILGMVTYPKCSPHKYRDTLELGVLSEIQELAEQFRPVES